MALELHTDSGLEAAFAAEDGAHQRPCSRLCGFFPKHSHAPLPQLPDTRQRGEGPQACLTHPGALLPTAKYGNKDLGVPQGVQTVTCTSRLGWRPESSAQISSCHWRGAGDWLCSCCSYLLVHSRLQYLSCVQGLHGGLSMSCPTLSTPSVTGAHIQPTLCPAHIYSLNLFSSSCMVSMKFLRRWGTYLTYMARVGMWRA